MKKIEAIIRTTKFEDVKAQLKEIGIDFFSYWDASGIGNEHLRGHQKTIECIEKAAFTGEVGDGMIFSYNIEESVRISNGSRGEASTAGPGDEKLTK